MTKKALETTLTKASLISILSKSEKIPKPDAKIIVECFFASLIEQLVSGKTVKISGFGNFVLRDKKDRPGRNPKTGEPAIIKARRVVTFRAGHKLKARVAAYKGKGGLEAKAGET